MADVKAMVAELKALGYRVVKENRIRVVSAQEAVSILELDYARDIPERKLHLYRNLGRSLGDFLMANGAVPVIEEMGSHNTRLFRASLTAIVDDPKFDWPYEMRLSGK